MSNASSSSSSGIGFFGLLTIVFIVLKLTGYISWSWFWVLAPFFAPLILLISLAFVYVLVIGMLRK
jgi:hypothetical protein